MAADGEQYPEDLLREVWEYPLGQAITGRRSRRFGLGMEIPGGPLAFKSQRPPLPLSDIEQTILLCAATGVSGWSFGVPYTTATPDAYPSYTLRLTGRNFPTGAGIGTPELFYTDDNGTYMLSTRDLPPEVEQPCRDASDFQRMAQQVRNATFKLSDQRLDIPRESPHISEHNLWSANFPGSTLLIPVTNLSEQYFSSLTMRLLNGYQVYDDWAKRPAGNLEPFVRSGLLSESKRAPLSVMEQSLIANGTGAMTTLAHNAVLVMQAMGLGGWMFSGINTQTALGVHADRGLAGLGFRFIRDERWTLPNPVGLDGHYEGFCPPYYADMRQAAWEMWRRKFGEGGTYDPDREGPFVDNQGVKESVVRHSEEFVECLGEITQYIYDTYGKFPGTVPTIMVGLYVQAQHIDTEFYDARFREGSYLETHRQHLARWHAMA